MAYFVRALSFVAGTWLLAAGLIWPAQASSQSKNVIELYTSQGCSSCPRADALLKKYADRPNVIALSFNVDYWDYLGWKDTLGKPAHSQRQRAYAVRRGDGRVYTPQVIANGLHHAIGSDEYAVDSAMKKSEQRLSGQRIEMALTNSKDTLVIRVGAGPRPAKPATIYIAAVSPSVKVDIERGENRGETITYHNVVRKLIPVGMWSGDEATIKLRHQDVMSAGGKRCVVLIQSADAGPIIAAQWMPE